MTATAPTPTPDIAAEPRALLELAGIDPARLRALLADAASVLRDPAPTDALAGRTVANLFFEDSTRTRLSFTLAARAEGAEAIDLTSAGSSVSKGESVADTARTVEAMGVAALVVRHRSAGAAHVVARAVRCAVLNAGDGRHEHPTQGLLDALTIAEAHGRLDSFDFSGLRIAIVGDIASSRVARSDVAALRALGASVVCVGPPALAPDELACLGCEVSQDLDAQLADADAIQMLRIQFERHDAGSGGASPVGSIHEYREGYALSPERAARMKPSAIVMHPGPINRDVELSAAVADGPRSRILRQVTLGVAVRRAVLRASVHAAEGGAR